MYFTDFGGKTADTIKVDITEITAPAFSTIEELVDILQGWTVGGGPTNDPVLICDAIALGDGSWTNVGEDNYIDVRGKSHMGLYVKQEWESAINPKIRIMLLRTDDPTDKYILERTGLYVKDLFSENKEVFYQFDLDYLVNYVQIQSMCEGSSAGVGDTLTIHLKLS